MIQCTTKYTLSITAGIISAFCFSFVGIFIIELSNNYDFNTFELASLRGIFQMIFIGIIDTIYNFVYLKHKYPYFIKFWYVGIYKTYNQNKTLTKPIMNQNYGAVNHPDDIDAAEIIPIITTPSTESPQTKIELQDLQDTTEIRQTFDTNIHILKWISVTGFMSSIKLNLLYITYISLNYGDTVTVFSSYVVITFIVAYFILNEPIYWQEILCMIIVIIGIVCIAQPTAIFGSTSIYSSSSDDETNNEYYEMLYYLLDIFCAIIASLIIVLTRKIKIENNNIKNNFEKYRNNILVNKLYLQSLSLFIVGLIFSLIDTGNYLDCLTNHSSDTSGLVWLYLILMGLCGVIGIILFNYSILTLKSGEVGIIRSCDVIMCYILEYFVLNQLMNLLSLIGAVLIVISIMVVTLAHARNVAVHANESVHVDAASIENVNDDNDYTPLIGDDEIDKEYQINE